MPHLLFLFLDGVGLGTDDPETNPFATANLPTLHGLIGGQRLLATTPAVDGGIARFVPTDAGMGVAGTPQSASGQASILTGTNVPARINGHWGPKPNAAIREIIQAGTVFDELLAAGRTVALANAYPPGYFEVTESGKRLHGTIPMAMTAAGVALYTVDDFRAGRGFSADWTGEGWRAQLGIKDVPVYPPAEAGRRLAQQAQQFDLFFFDHWPTDFMGHRGTLDGAVAALEAFDAVLAGVLDHWNLDDDLIVITSDHGNLEDMSQRRHTTHRVPTLVIGAQRAVVADGLSTLADIAPGMRRFFGLVR